MHKIACLFSFRESSWVSCQKIVFNLHKAYEKVPDLEIKNFDYGPDCWGTEIVELQDALLKYAPDTIVIMDHKPHPIHILKLLLSKIQSKTKPRLIFHVFGDFTLYYRDWSALGKLMEDFPVEFIVASDRQKILIDQFLTPPHECHVCPFPVKPDEFFFSAEERKKQRKDWGVSDDDLVFTFTGRLSRQKRTHLLLKTFTAALEMTATKKAHLFIYGQADDLGDNFLQIWDQENEYFRKIHRQYMELPASARERIHFMGNVPNSELRQVYAGADYLVNLSVHNDEDYGMSVAEAQMTGLPSILTDWGGLASFEHPTLPEATKFIKVKIGNRSKVISSGETIRALAEAMKSPVKIPRENLVALANGKLSIESASKIIKRVLAEDGHPFVSFSEFHTMIAKRMAFLKPVYLDRNHLIHPIFRKLYTSYVRNS